MPRVVPKTESIRRRPGLSGLVGLVCVLAEGCCGPCSIDAKDRKRNEYTIEVTFLDTNGAVYQAANLIYHGDPSKAINVSVKPTDVSVPSPRIYLVASNDRFDSRLFLEFPEEVSREDIASVEIDTEFTSSMTIDVAAGDLETYAVDPAPGTIFSDGNRQGDCEQDHYREDSVGTPPSAQLDESGASAPLSLGSFFCRMSALLEPKAYASSCGCSKGCTVFFRDRDRVSLSLPEATSE